jgi:hypothetical protein
MSAISLRARVRTLIVALAAVGALALVAACGAGAVAASGPVSTTRALHAVKQSGEGNNWAGYVIQPGQDVDYVSGEWTVPTLNCSQTTTIDSVWAGIGGVAGQALLQTWPTAGRTSPRSRTSARCSSSTCAPGCRRGP